MLVYLAGPMSGYPEWNYPKFRGAAAALRNHGFDVINPAETAGGATHLPRETFMSIDIGYVEAADAVVVLPGWQHSQGAQLEVLLATNLGKPVYRFHVGRGVDRRIVVTSTQVGFTEEDL